MLKLNRLAGFSLVELMVAMAIISLIASIAIPRYMRYLALVKTGAAQAELRASLINIENEVSSGNLNPSLSDIGTAALASVNCTFSLTNSSDGASTFSCALINPPYVITGGVISYVRSNGSTWTCQVNAAIGTTYAPNGCTVGG